MIQKPIILILLLVTIEAVQRRKVSVVVFKNITYDFNPNNSEYFNFSISPSSNGRSFDFNWKPSHDIPNNVHQKLVALIKIPTEVTYRQIFAYEFNICRLWDGFMSQTIARMWYKNIRKFGNYPIRCPIKKGTYYLKRMSMDISSVPTFIVNGQYMALLEQYIQRGSVKDMIFNSTIEVEIERK